MKTFRSLFARLFSTLALGCALLVFAPAPQALAQKKIPPPLTLTPALLDKAEKVTTLLAADASAKAELEALNHEDELDPTVPETDDAITKKYPKLAAVYKAADIKPHEFIGAFITMLVAGAVADGRDSDLEVSQANVDFVKANRERVKAIAAAVIGKRE